MVTLSDKEKRDLRVSAIEVELTRELREMMMKNSSDEIILPGEGDLIDQGHAAFLFYSAKGTFLCTVNRWSSKTLGVFSDNGDGDGGYGDG